MNRSTLGKCLLPAWARASMLMSRFERRKYTELLRPIRIAFVKNASYRDLYFKVGPFDEATIFSSEGRSGPVGLIEDEFDASFFIVRNSEDPECQVHIREDRNKLSGEMLNTFDSQISRMRDAAVDPEDVDWSHFDIVWAFESAIPARVTRRYPQVVWAAMLESHMRPEFLSYLRHPPTGYDLFFTQAFGPNPRSLLYGKHVVDWPYALCKHNTIEKLFPEEKKRADLFMCEVHHDMDAVRRAVSKTRFNLPEARSKNERLAFRDFLKLLVQSRYYLSPCSARSLWGNALPEAGSAGCLVLANPSQNWNPFTITKEARAFSLKQAIDQMQAFDHSNDFFNHIKKKQDALIDWHCFYRPIFSMLGSTKSLESVRKLNIRSSHE